MQVLVESKRSKRSELWVEPTCQLYSWGLGLACELYWGWGPHYRYEEENFVRLPTRRKASVAHDRLVCGVLQVTHTSPVQGKARGPSSTLNDIDKFGNENALFGQGAAQKKSRRSLSRKAKKRGWPHNSPHAVCPPSPPLPYTHHTSPLGSLSTGFHRLRHHRH